MSAKTVLVNDKDLEVYCQRYALIQAERGGSRDEEVSEALLSLSPKELEVVYLLAYDMHTQTTAAKKLGVSRTVVKARWTSALRTLKGTLEPKPTDAVLDRIDEVLAHFMR